MQKGVEKSCTVVKELTKSQQEAESIRDKVSRTIRNELKAVKKECVEAMEEREKLTNVCIKTFEVLEPMKAEWEGASKRCH